MKKKSIDYIHKEPSLSEKNNVYHFLIDNSTFLKIMLQNLVQVEIDNNYLRELIRTYKTNQETFFTYLNQKNQYIKNT